MLGFENLFVRVLKNGEGFLEKRLSVNGLDG